MSPEHHGGQMNLTDHLTFKRKNVSTQNVRTDFFFISVAAKGYQVQWTVLLKLTTVTLLVTH